MCYYIIVIINVIKILVTWAVSMLHSKIKNYKSDFLSLCCIVRGQIIMWFKKTPPNSYHFKFLLLHKSLHALAQCSVSDKCSYHSCPGLLLSSSIGLPAVPQMFLVVSPIWNVFHTNIQMPNSSTSFRFLLRYYLKVAFFSTHPKKHSVSVLIAHFTFHHNTCCYIKYYIFICDSL